MFKKILITTALLATGATTLAKDNIKKMYWDGVEVVWLEDNRFPTYDIQVYFADGALSDGNKKAITESMFNLIDAGTRRFSQKDIVDNLDYYGVSYSSNVNHEYSKFVVSGLVKDIDPTMRKICHLFKDSVFPKNQLNIAKKRAKNHLMNLSTDHASLASRAFREISLYPSPFSYPTGGKLSDIKRISQRDLKNKLEYFNKTVLKRIYLTGPKNVLSIKRIINEDCGWTGSAQFVRKVNFDKRKVRKGPHITLVTVDKANQAQVRFGKLLLKDEYEKRAPLTLASHYLGGGFTSRLMRELRSNRGFVYSVSAFAGGQKDYGRSVISTFTKNENVIELIKVVKGILANSDAKTLDKTKDFALSQSSLAGSHPFKYESNSSFLSELMFMDHVGREYSEIYNFPNAIMKSTPKDVADSLHGAFNWDDMNIVILGDKSLLKSLKKEFKNVRAVAYKRYL